MIESLIDTQPDAEFIALTDRLRRNSAGDQILRGAYNTLGGILKTLPASDDLLMSPEAMGAWRTLRDHEPAIYLTYRAAVRQKCGRAITDLLDHHIGPPRAGSPREIVLLSPTDMWQLSTGADLVENWIPSRGIVSVIGAPGSAKSAFIDHVFNSLAADIAPIAGKLYRPCASLVIAPEGNRMPRLRAWCRHHDVDYRKLPVRYIQQGVDLRSSHGDIDQILDLIDAVEADLGKLDIVAIDTLNRAFGGGSENEAADMGLFLSNLQRIVERTNGTVIVLHHLGKDATRGARGHGSLLGAVDAEITITRDADDIRTAKVTKSRDGVEGSQLSFRLKVIDLGQHPDPQYAAAGRRLDSVVIEPLSDQSIPDEAKQSRITPGARVALDALKSALARHGEYPAGAAEADRNRMVDGEHWRAAYEANRPINADDADGRKAKQSRRMAFNRAQDQLQAARIVGTHVGKWWLL